MFRVYCVLIGYALGHLQASYILARMIKKIDIREHGTKNAGATNSLKVLGPRFAIPILIIDVMKSCVAFAICAAVFGGLGAFVDFSDSATLEAVIQNPWLPGVYGSLGAILGHMFPVYMRFRGGKGTACCVGMAFSMHVLLGGAMILIAAMTVLVTRYVSASALVSLATLPVIIALFDNWNPDPRWGLEVIGAGYFVAVFLTIKHKKNIRELLNGIESRIGRKAKHT